MAYTWSRAAAGGIPWKKQETGFSFVLRGPTSSPLVSLPAVLPLPRLGPISANLFDAGTVTTSIRSTSNLFAACGFVILMQKHGQLKPESAQVLSEASFKLAIPCFLMSKVASTISMQHDWRLLSLPLMALFQVTIGILVGKLADILMFLDSSAYSSQKKNDGSSFTKLLLVPTCAFGNSVSLPLVFLSGMLSQTDYTTASGYIALYLVGWSSCLWTLGRQLLNSTSQSSKQVKNNWSSSLNNLFYLWNGIMNPPLYGVLLGILVGATHLSCLCISSKLKLMPNINHANNFISLTISMVTNILQPITEGARLLGSAAVPLQIIILALSLASSISSDRNDKDLSAGRKKSVIANIDGNSKENVLFGKVFWVATIIKLLIMPSISVAILNVIRHQGWFPKDPLISFVLLVLSAMPSAQNLVVLAQINPHTRPYTGTLANILLGQYLLALVSVTFWLPVFSSFLRL